MTSAVSYDFKAIEAKWQRFWLEHKTFRTPNPGEPGFDPAKRKFYVLDMFPYPSGVGLHVGHPLGYIATDIFARFMRMRGFNVLHPMGYDAFGLPAEQYAIEHGVPPRETTEKNIATMRAQMQRLGLGYDWDREIATTDVGFYKWTQWIFLQLYNSWYDPAENAARPIRSLEQKLEQEHLVVRFDGELVAAELPVMQALTINPPLGTQKWVELSQPQRREVLDNYRLAYLAEVPVNWCPALGTVLANEEVTADGRSERGNHPVYRRPLRQWMLRITAYAERLEDDLELVDWPEPIKLMQRNWIGRSEGAEVDFAVEGSDEVIRVYTTRPDTLFGATYMVLAPEHELVETITTEAQRPAVQAYVETARNKSDLERTAETKEKTGVYTGAYAINPVNNERIPIWVADYVLMGYGTGAIMAVPAHDTRDFEFAKRFGLTIKAVVSPPDNWFIEQITKSGQKPITAPTVHVHELTTGEISSISESQASATFGPEFMATIRKQMQSKIESLPESAIRLISDAYVRDPREFSEAYTGDGIAVNSGGFNGLPTAEFKQRIAEWLEENGLGQAAVNYKLRDWLFSRQRYWGEPFPIVHDAETDEVYPLDESELPVELPELHDFRPHAVDDPNAAPSPPLGRATEWVNVGGYITEKGTVKLVHQGRSAPDGVQVRPFHRELNTMPQWAGSCWYYLRYLDPHQQNAMVDPAIEKHWMVSLKSDGTPHAGGVDLYVGGAEHAVLHLLYSRFWHKVLFDLGHVSTPEPFGRLFNQGYIQAYAYQDSRGLYVDVHDVEECGEGKQARFVRKSNGESLTRSLGKMGKSLKNAVSPDEIGEEYGADTLRAYEMYMGPLEASKPWSTRDIVGMSRFLHAIWRRFVAEDGTLKVTDDPASDELRRWLHKTIKRVTADMAGLHFNTAIAALIELNNAMKGEQVPREVAEPMLKLLSPIAPHLAEELWQRLQGSRWTRSISFEPWPQYDEALCVDEMVEIPVQVNGKLRSRIMIAPSASEEEMKTVALADARIAQELAGKTIRKTVCVPGRMVNIVAN